MTTEGAEEEKRSCLYAVSGTFVICLAPIIDKREAGMHK
jgi:hypothetical protein